MTQTRYTRYPCLVLCVLLVCTLFTLFQFISACVRHDAEVCKPAEDFSLFYMAGIHAREKDISKVYDVKYAKELLDMPAGIKVSFEPLLYPPQSLLLLSGLGFFSYNMALALWFGIPLLMLLACLRSGYANSLMPSPSPFIQTFSQREKALFPLPPGEGQGEGKYGKTIILLMIFLPFLLVAFLAGQNGILWVAVMIMVLMWRKEWPLFAGLALALFSIKPQLGIFLPLLLLYEKNWVALAAACIAALAMAALSVAIWGTDPWVSYLELAQVFSQIEKITPQDYLFPAASPFMAFRMLDLNTDAAFALQLLISITVLGAVWKSFHHCKADWQIIMLISTAPLLFSAYSYIYDDILLALPCIVLFERLKEGVTQAPERIALILMAFIPIVAIKLHHMHIPYSFIAILFSFITTIRLIRKSEHAVLPA